MKIKHLPIEFINALPILEKINNCGYDAYFVGGSVRDLLLNMKIHDVDIASNAYPSEIKQIFQHTVDTGIQHGTVTVIQNGIGYEITTFRTESGYQDFRRPDSVQYVNSLVDDLKRRDFTINALAMTVEGNIIDYFNGISDLKNKLIKAVGNPNKRFSEDALRMMRAVRFESQLGFNLELHTYNAISKNYYLLNKISIERIHVEFVKMMMGKWRKLGLKTFIDSNLYKECPDFKDNLQGLCDILKMPDVVLNTEESVWILIILNFNFPLSCVKKFLILWKNSNNVINVVLSSVVFLRKWKDNNLKLWDYYLINRKVLNVSLNIMKVYYPDINIDVYRNIYNNLPIHNRNELKISGSDIINHFNMKQGPKIGNIISDVEKKVVNGILNNDVNNILNYIKQKDIKY